MNFRREKSAPRAVAPGAISLHLLDSSQGHSIQSWSFSEQSPITIGRADTCDVAISDPHVSRVHVRLEFEAEKWVLVSMGRHGTIMDDRVIAEQELEHKDVFRLGGSGPMLQFELGVQRVNMSETIENVDPNIFNLFEIDEERKAEEVEGIASDKVFAKLLEQTRSMKAHRPESQDGAAEDG